MINKDVVIVYNKFLCPNGENRVLGGIETYLHYLASLLGENTTGKVTIIQPANKEFEITIGNYLVIGKKFSSAHKRVVCRFALEVATCNQAILIFAADQFSIKTDYKYAISIMHGVSWDLPAKFFTGNGGVSGLLGKIPVVGNLLAKKYVIFQRLRDIRNCRNNVIVDYNSINWYRTQFTNELPFDYKVILNFALDTYQQVNIQRQMDDDIKILFARRFQRYRGIDLMISAVFTLLQQNRDVKFCFAGEGPDEQKLRELFSFEPRVTITKYDSDKSLEFHHNFHIAVVPSLASEGSSLSLAEAMMAGCAVVASDVGGMTNMVIDGYNGILVKPSVSSLTQALQTLIDDKQLRQQLAFTGRQSAATAFSHKKWCKHWLELVTQVVEL